MKKVVPFLAIVALIVLAALPAMASGGDQPTFCGEKVRYGLWAGKTIDVGYVLVGNTEDALYVTYQTYEGWYLKAIHLYVLNYEPTERLTPGHAPFKVEGIYERSWTLVIPFRELGLSPTCGETVLWLQAHADVHNSSSGESETAYGGTIYPDAKPWYGNIAYTVQCCEEEHCYEFMDETAWAAGIRYVRKGNWATYTPYVPDSTVTLYAGQTINVGTVHFSAPVDGYVTITINLTGNWEFAPEYENVKIQDYATTPPSVNPAPGLFAWKGTASGKSFSIAVPQNNFYGVHVDVGYWVEVMCPAE